MTNDCEETGLEAEIEKERVSIADLQERVKELVKRREDKTSLAKSEEIGELQRKIDTIKEDHAKTATHIENSPAHFR